MGDGEDSSWLFSVIDRVDKLALTIGGYEEGRAPEHRFSDDESDSSSSSSSKDGDDSGNSGFEDTTEDDGDDSGFEDAPASPGRPRKAQNGVEPLEDGDAPSTVMTLKPESSSNRVPLVSSAEKGPSLSAKRPQSNQDCLDLVDVPASEEAHLGKALATERPSSASSVDRAPSVSVTPSHSQDCFAGDSVPVLVERPLGQQGAAGCSLDPVFSTPAHSRDRDASNRGPPLAAIPLGPGSRRAHRARHRSNEGLNVKSPDDMNTSRKAAQGHASPAGASDLPRSTSKKYSHVGDTAWLKPKGEGDLPETPTTASQLEMESADAAGGRAPIRASTSSALADDSPTSDGAAYVPVVGTVGVAPASTARRNWHRSESEMEQQLRQDTLPRVCTKDLQAERLSGKAKDVRVEDVKVNGGRMAVTGNVGDAVALAYPEESPAPSESSSVDLPQKQIDTSRQDETFEGENGARYEEVGEDGGHQEEAHREEEEKDGVGSPPPGMSSGLGVIGAKRASTENGTGTHDEDWILDSPEGFAPSKRGKTQSEHPLAVMRHSARLDDAIFEQQRKLGTMTAESGSDEDGTKSGSSNESKRFKDGEGDDLAAIPWPDRALRPYDSPIIDTDLPARQAKALGRLGMDSETSIICSPFRRCLQTAGVVARTLGVASVTVDLQLGERMDKVRKEIAELALANEEKWNVTSGSKQPVAAFSYLEESDMREALGAGVQLEEVVGEQPPEEESGIEAKQRFIATIAKVREEQLRDSPVLLVAHGDTLDAAGESLASQIIFEANYCAWALFDLDMHCGYVTESYGIQMIPL